MADNSPSRFSQGSNDSPQQQQQQNASDALSLQNVQQAITSSDASRIVYCIKHLKDVPDNSENLATMTMLLRTAMYEEKSMIDPNVNGNNMMRYEYKLTKLFMNLSIPQLSTVLSSPQISSKQLQKFILQLNFDKFNVQHFIKHYQGMSIYLLR